MDGTGTPTAINTFGANGLLSRRTGGVNGSSVFYTFDLQGSVSQRFDRTGNLLSSDEYDAWGAVLSRTPTGTTDVFGAGAQWGYYTDGETGLLLLTHRYYDAGTGRFINRDPIGYAGGINLYAYVGNGPTNFADPLGLFGFRDAYVLGGAVLGGVGGFVVSGGNPLGAAIGFGLGAGLARYRLEPDAGAALDTGLGAACTVATLGEFAGAAGSALPMSGLPPGEAPAAEESELVDVYRGVAANHFAIEDARQGIVNPIGGPNSPAQHNEGFTESQYTSWTTELGVAEYHAGRGGPGGVVLYDRVPRSELIPSPDMFRESEVLRRGPIRGVTDIWHR
jgi:RHS repeat-associated protein